MLLHGDNHNFRNFLTLISNQSIRPNTTNTMVITADQKTAFFTESGQMDIPADTCVAITQGGLEDLADLVVFDKKRNQTDHQ